MTRRHQTLDRKESAIKREEPDTASGESTGERKDRFPLVCKPTQCIFCLGNESKPYQERLYEYAKPNKMMNEVEKHLIKYAPEDQILCPHLQCKAAGLVLPSVMGFKNHMATVHKIFLRA